MADVADIYQFIDDELSRTASAPVLAMAEACADRFGAHAAGVLFYGSCLRTGQVDGMVLDFYVLVDDYRAAYGAFLPGFANRMLPPNVYYKEMDFMGEGAEQRPIRLRAKYAVLSVDDFVRRASGQTLNLSVWARFSQPALLCLCDDEGVRARISRAVAAATCVMIGAARETAGDDQSSRNLWTSAFNLTYGAELRSEGADKGRELYELDKARYDAMTPLVKDALRRDEFNGLEGGPARWFLRRANGKFVSFMRLVKGAFTFDGGIDYLAWKISRHSGVEITPTPWQRRHPILAGLSMFIRLRRRGAFR